MVDPMKSFSGIRWGILGTGMIAGRFAADLPHSRTGRLTAVASRNAGSATAFAKLHNCQAISGYKTLLARADVDAVYIGLPNALHYEWTIAALEAGKHVLCEKPMALSESDAREMFAKAEATGRILIEAFMYRAHPQTGLIRETIAKGAIGEIQLIRTNFTFKRDASRYDARYRSGPGGGSLMDVGCYCVDFTRTLLGAEPDRVQCLAHKHEFGVDDFAAGVLGFSNGSLATFTCGMTVLSDQTAHIAGTEGRVEITRFWQGKEGFSLISPDGKVERFEVQEERPIYAVEADAFAEVVAGAPNWNAPENTLGNLRVLEELRRTAGFE